MKTPAETWLDAALEVLGAGGPEAIRVESLARTLGVSKGGFYWHFPDRPTFLQRVLDRWELRAVTQVIERIESHDASPRDRLRELFGLARAEMAGGGIAIELAVRDWARRDPAVAARLAAVDEQRASYLRSLFVQITDDPLDAEARTLVVASLYIGTHFLVAGHPAHSRGEVIARALEDQLR